MITKHSKLLFLFFSRENPLWEHLLGHLPTQLEISDATGIKQSTLSNWRNGGEIDRKTIAKSFEHLQTQFEVFDSHRKKQLLRTVRQFADAYTSVSATSHSEFRIYDVATDILGMTIEQCQKIIDEVIYDKFTIFPTVCYGSSQEAAEPFARFGGNYHLWVRREVGNTEIWLKCPLRARYILKLKNGAGIRCKLNAPILRPEVHAFPHWEYDGFLRTRNNKVFWIFEKREQLGSDFFHMITDWGHVHKDKGHERLTLQGAYLTTGQDSAQSIVTSAVVLQRLSLGDIDNELQKNVEGNSRKDEHATAHKIKEWMGKTAKPVYKDDPECLQMNNLWKHLKDVNEDLKGNLR